jgi:aspartyl/glutamyl-tRNA(Asn/Gln) amidotransferase C subunit
MVVGQEGVGRHENIHLGHSHGGFVTGGFWGKLGCWYAFSEPRFNVEPFSATDVTTISGNSFCDGNSPFIAAHMDDRSDRNAGNKFKFDPYSESNVGQIYRDIYANHHTNSDNYLNGNKESYSNSSSDNNANAHSHQYGRSISLMSKETFIETVDNPMHDEINQETFEHLVDLAALELIPGEGDYLRRELNNQLKAVHELEAIPLEGDVAVTSHGVAYTRQISPATRQDEWLPCENPAEILSAAPQVEDGYIVVPDIPHTTLE